MSRLTAVLLLSLGLLLPASLTAGSNSTKLHWQEGEILSRKTIPSGHSGIRYQYLYRLRGGDAHYVVVAKEPLNVELQTPMKYAPLRRHILIRDTDGRECKVRVVERSKRAFSLWR